MADLPKHTPTPWSSWACEIWDSRQVRIHELQPIIRNGIADYNEAGENAKHIVKCVNMHDELVALLTEIDNSIDFKDCNRSELGKRVKKLIAKAEAI